MWVDIQDNNNAKMSLIGRIYLKRIVINGNELTCF